MPTNLAKSIIDMDATLEVDNDSQSDYGEEVKEPVARNRPSAKSGKSKMNARGKKQEPKQMVTDLQVEGDSRRTRSVKQSDSGRSVREMARLKQLEVQETKREKDRKTNITQKRGPKSVASSRTGRSNRDQKKQVAASTGSRAVSKKAGKRY